MGVSSYKNIGEGKRTIAGKKKVKIAAGLPRGRRRRRLPGVAACRPRYNSWPCAARYFRINPSALTSAFFTVFGEILNKDAISGIFIPSSRLIR